jgi:hypothetical protein
MAEKQPPSTPAKNEWLHEGWRELLASPLAALASPGAVAQSYPKVVTFEGKKLGLTLQRGLFSGKVRLHTFVLQNF